MTFDRLHHIQLTMPRGAEPAAAAFYADVLGLVEVDKPAALAERGGAWFRSGGVELHLGVEDDFRPSGKGHPGILVTDLDELVRRLADAGQDVSWDAELPGFRRVYAHDPFGNRLEFLAAGTPAPAAFTNTEAEWDERYTGNGQVWSGRPNVGLVTEMAGLTPGRALDVGCGEGADAVWLAGQGWEVTALDVSQVALERAAVHARDAGVTVSWVHAGLLDAPLAPAAFDLVSAQYPALLRTQGQDAERSLLAAVAPGGCLLVVHHAQVDMEQASAHEFDPQDYVGPAEVAVLLGHGWRVDVDETRPRSVTSGAGAHHTQDVVLRATRLR